MNRLRSWLVLSAVALSTIVAATHGEWAPDGITVCSAAGEQVSPALIADGTGGAIVIWEDTRNAVRNIYAQRIDASGTALWATDGVAACPFPFNQLTSQLVSDGLGGAIIVWEDIRHGVANKDIYAQRLDASGTPRWTTEGVAVCRAPYDQSGPKLVTDTAGGAIIAWTDYRSGSGDIYAQRINASGLPLWGNDGLAVCEVEDTQGAVELVADGAAGAILLWADFRTSAVTARDIYGQRLDAAGRLLWTLGGVPVCSAGGNQNRPKLIADGAAGAIVAWYDDRGSTLDIFAQRMSGFGVRMWSSEGVPVCTAAGIQQSAELTTDRAGGAIIAWQDARSGIPAIYAQRIDAAGNSLWAKDGVAISSSASTAAFPALGSFASGGAAIAWQSVSPSGETDIYAQRIAGSGSIDGAGLTTVCTAPRNQGPPRLLLDAIGGTLFVWNDERDRNNDIYAQRMDNPTAIGLLEFTAAATPEGVALSWQLASEARTDLNEIIVQRALDASGAWLDLAALLPSPVASFVDTGASPGQIYWYRLLLVGPAGLQASIALQVDYSPAGSRTVLYPPTETVDGIVFRYALAVAGQPHLEIFDVLGRRVQILEPGLRAPGEHFASWDRTSVAGTRAARGIYVVRMRVGQAATARKLVLSR